MKSTSVFKPLCVLVTSLVLMIWAPQAFARGGGHGGGGFGGGGFHGGGGGFHGGGGGFHAGGAGWHGGGFGGWRGGGWGWGGRGWGCCGWGGWGWGFGVGFGWGWGWGSYWGGYPYAYGYPYYPYPYYYPYYPSYYDGPYASTPPARDPYNTRFGDDSARQYSSTPDWDNDSANPVTTKATTPWRPSSDQLLSNSGPTYRTANSTAQQFAGLRPQARNVMRALLAMPPEARRRQVESGRYSNFSAEEQELFRKAAQLPPARAAPMKNDERVKGQLELTAAPMQ